MLILGFHSYLLHRFFRLFLLRFHFFCLMYVIATLRHARAKLITFSVISAAFTVLII